MTNEEKAKLIQEIISTYFSSPLPFSLVTGGGITTPAVSARLITVDFRSKAKARPKRLVFSSTILPFKRPY